MKNISLCVALSAIAAFAQSKPAFEVATVKPSGPLDMAKIQATAKAGGKMPFGPKVESGRAEYTFMDLKSLIALAYEVRPDQVAGPDWMEEAPFDIVAKMPAGSTNDDAPKMLRTLLEERFKLTTHRTSAEHPVLALVVGKGSLKMKPTAQPTTAETAPPKPGETTMDMGQGMKMSMNAATGASTLDLGPNGKLSIQMNAATKAMHMDLTAVTMAGLAGWLTTLSTNNDGPQVVDMTELKGAWDASVDTDLSLMATTPGDPGGGASSRMTYEVQSLGLKLESRRAVVDQLVIDRVEKTPTAN